MTIDGVESINEVEIARRGEDGKLYFVKNGKPVSDAWSETGQKFKVFYNGRPYYFQRRWHSRN